MIIHLVTDYLSTGGGLEHIYQIVKGSPNYQFKVFARPGNAAGKFDELKNVTIQDQGFEPGLVMAGNPDLVHIHHLRPLVSFFKNPLTRYKVPIIYTAHGLHIHKYEFFNSLSGKIKYKLRFALEKQVCKKPARVIAVSMEDQEFMAQNYGLKNVLYLTNGIEFTDVDLWQDADPQQLRKELKLPLDRVLFTTVARFDFQKGYDIYIPALAQLKKKVEGLENKVHFLFVGGGSQLEPMKNMASEYGIEDLVTFMGERRDVYQLLKASDLFVLPSRWEGLPITLLEAGRLKIPVLASHTYGNREILGEGRGILFQNLDANDLALKLQEIIQNKYDLLQYANKLHHEVSQNYNLPKMLTGLQNLYTHLT